MKLKVSQRPEVFFDLFVESAVNLHAATGELRAPVDDYTDMALKARRILEREHEGDEVTHALLSVRGAACARRGDGTRARPKMSTR